MTNNSNHHANDEIDPYVILDLPYAASESEIQTAFHRKMKTAKDQELLIKAYGMIRNRTGRERWRWSSINSYLLNPFEGHKKDNIDIEALIKELAFLSEWEMGEDACPN